MLPAEMMNPSKEVDWQLNSHSHSLDEELVFKETLENFVNVTGMF